MVMYHVRKYKITENTKFEVQSLPLMVVGFMVMIYHDRIHKTITKQKRTNIQEKGHFFAELISLEVKDDHLTK